MVSKEYGKFLKEGMAKLSLYERACSISEKILPLKPTRETEEKLREAIEFSHLMVTPKGALSLALLSSLLIILIPSVLLLIFNSISLTAFILLALVSGLVFYYLFDYPFHYSTVFRIKASSEMVLAIVYMSISMRVTPNIEKAIEFTSRNLKGPLALDLKKLLWDIYSGKYASTEQALNVFMKKWERESKEFIESISLIRNSLAETQEKREKMLDEAVSVVLEGTKERMRHYAQDLKVPLTLLNSMGILLPVVGLVFFPIASLFLPELIKPIFLILGYNLFLPLGVYFLMKSYLEKRPYSFHQPDLSRHPKFAKELILEKPFLPIAISLPLIFFGSFNIFTSKEIFSFFQLLNSLLITLGVTIGIVSYSFLSVFRKLKVREEISRIESEFAEALFQLGSMLSRGINLETSLKKVVESIRNFKIAEFFKKTLSNIEILGMTFEQAIFEKRLGSINFFPSGLIEAVMKVVVETSKKGMVYASKAMLAVSSYLKDMHSVEEDLKSLLEEVTSAMKIQALLLAPLSAGIVVSLAAIMMQILISLHFSLEEVYAKIALPGIAGAFGGGVVSSLVNLNQIIPVHIFQLVVGIYLVEVVSILAISLSVITNGEEDLLKRLTVAKILFLATIIYSVIMLLTYLGFTSLIPLPGLAGPLP